MRTNNSNILLELENINSRNIPSVILLFGKNSFLKDQFTEKIRSKSLSKDEISFNHDVFDLNSLVLDQTVTRNYATQEICLKKQHLLD